MGKICDADPNGREMYRDESLERFIEGLKVSASCARELHELAPNEAWDKVAEQLKYIFAAGTKLSRKRAFTRQALLQHTDEMAARMGTDRR